MFENGNVLTLSDDNEYIVIDKFIDNDKDYVYLVDINDNKNVLFGKLQDDEIVEINDPDELERIIKIINNHIKES